MGLCSRVSWRARGPPTCVSQRAGRRPSRRRLRATAEAPAVLLPPTTLSKARILYATVAAPGHDTPGHPECAARVPAILDALQGLALTSRPEVVELTGFAPATREEILAVHSKSLVNGMDRFRDFQSLGVSSMDIDPAPTYVTATSVVDAYLAAGAVLALVDNVVAASRAAEAEAASAASGSGSKATQSSGGAPAAFAICRPPGHHSMPTHSMGFCLFGNCAIAARYAQQRHGLKRVMIFDFDVHHGNGTEAAFYSDPDVLFISTHQEFSYPNTGKLAAVGSGAGEGANINLPLPGLSGQAAVLEVFEGVVAPAARRFHPDIILVSAGYDAHWADPLAGLQFRTTTYHALGERLKALADELCSGRLVFLLEGGYDLEALGASVANTFLGLLGEQAVDAFDPGLLQEEPMAKVEKVLREARSIHSL